MRISSIGYALKSGVKNIFRNKMFSIASVLTMSACIFLFGLFYSVISNFSYIIKGVEEGVSMTVFFEDGTDQATMDEVGLMIEGRGEVKDIKYVSAMEAWQTYAKQYFGEQADEFAAGFKNDNPLANSAKYEIYVHSIEEQTTLKNYVKGLPKVKEVNQSVEAVKTLTTMNRLVKYISFAIIGILLVVAVFLISNTVSVGINVRRDEIAIMKLIGATNLFTRLPFIMEGVLIGLIGAALPLLAFFFMYNKAVKYILEKFSVLERFMGGLMPVGDVFQTLVPIGLALGMGIGLVGSLFTIRKHLKV